MHHLAMREVFIRVDYAGVSFASGCIQPVHWDPNMVADTSEERQGSFPVLDIPDSHLVPLAKEAIVEWLPSDRLFFVSAPGLEGAWATGKTRQEALDCYPSVLREWISAAVHFGDPLPPMPTVQLDRYTVR